MARCKACPFFSPYRDPPAAGEGNRSGREELAQHERQNPAVQVVVDFDRCIDAQQQGNLLRRAILAMDRERHVHLRTDAFLDAGQIEFLVALDLERYHAVVPLELARQHTHADEVRAMDALEATRYDELD